MAIIPRLFALMKSEAHKSLYRGARGRAGEGKPAPPRYVPEVLPRSCAIRKTGGRRYAISYAECPIIFCYAGGLCRRLARWRPPAARWPLAHRHNKNYSTFGNPSDLLRRPPLCRLSPLLARRSSARRLRPAFLAARLFRSACMRVAAAPLTRRGTPAGVLCGASLSVVRTVRRDAQPRTCAPQGNAPLGTARR